MHGQLTDSFSDLVRPQTTVRSPVTISAEHTLTTFLCHAVAANRAEQKTLTLVVPRFIVLQPEFFCDLAEAWCSLREKLSLAPDTGLQIDDCRQESGRHWIWAWQHHVDLLRSRQAFRRRDLSDAISITRCLVVGRPNADASPIVLAIAAPGMMLPEWAKPAPMSLPRAA